MVKVSLTSGVEGENVTTLYVTMGIPGSGKSTWAKEFAGEVTDGVVCFRPPIVIVSPDAIRQELSGDASNQDMNADVFRLAFDRTMAALNKGQDVIFDATSTTARARQDILAFSHALRMELHVFDTPLPVALARNAGRDRVVPDGVIYRMFGQFCQSLSQIGYEDWDSIHFHRS